MGREDDLSPYTVQLACNQELIALFEIEHPSSLRRKLVTATACMTLSYAASQGSIV